jgi:hypothetical protein
MKSVAAGRKTSRATWAKRAKATVRTTGNTLTVAVTGPRLGAEQIEQEWCDVVELTGWEWTACAVPIANTSTAHNTPSTWAIWLRFRVARITTSISGV